jgi:hypothetical protein
MYPVTAASTNGMASIPVVIFGIRIPSKQTKAYVNKHVDGDGNYEEWELQEVADELKVPFVVVRRQYHDGDTSDLDELIENCPLYIGEVVHASDKSFDPYDMMLPSFPPLRDILDLFDMPSTTSTKPSFWVDVCDFDSGCRHYTPHDDTNDLDARGKHKRKRSQSSTSESSGSSDTDSSDSPSTPDPSHTCNSSKHPDASHTSS